MKKTALILVALSAMSLASCGGTETNSSDTGGYYVTTSEVGEDSVKFASTFSENQFVVMNSNSQVVSKVTASMVSGFDSTQDHFGTDLSAQVSYQGKSLELTYQISAYYAIEDSYTVYLLDGKGVNIDKVPNATTLSEFTVPDVVSDLPEPAKNWPVTKLSDYFSDSLTHLTLNKTITSIAGSLGHFTRVTPVDGGAMSFQNGFLADANHALYAIDSSLSGGITIPSDVTAVSSCAFAQPNTTITSVTIPANVMYLNDVGIGAYNLTNVVKFIVSSDNSKFESDSDGVVRRYVGAGKATIMIPAGHAAWTAANPLAFQETTTSTSLNCLYKHDNVQAISLPKSIQTVSCTYTISALAQLTLLNETKMVSISDTSLSKLPSTLMVKVPSSLLSTYQSDTVWGTIASQISAIA